MKRSLLVLVACGLWATVPVMLTVGCGGDDSGDSDHDDDHDHGDDDHGDAPDHDHENSDVGPKTGATCPDDSDLTYANFGMKFFSDYCTRCHSSKVTGAARMNAPADHNFDNLAQIELLAKHIDEKAGSGPDATNKTMPANGKAPTDAERKKLSEWIACGVPE